MQTHRLKIIVLKENKNQKRTEKRSKSKNELTQYLSTSSISLSLSSVLQSRRWEEKLIENRGTIAWVRLWVRRAAQRIPAFEDRPISDSLAVFLFMGVFSCVAGQNFHTSREPNE